MNNNKGSKLLDFLAGKGFYVVLILCVAAIGVSGYMLFFGGSGETPEAPSLAIVSPSPRPPVPPSIPSPAAPSVPPVAPPVSAVTPPFIQQGSVEDDSVVGVSGTDDEDSVETAAPAPPKPSPEPAEQKPASNGEPDFFMPVTGTELVGFSDKADVFYEALREWRYHPGIDLETNAGALVQAAADGVVKEVIENAPHNMGATIIIEHSGGFETVYGNLSGLMKVTAGQKVEAGQTIGAVGDSSISESALPPHLHFEILKDGEPVDPMDYLPEGL